MELQLEKYEILDEIGQGGMSIVYRGLDLSLERNVAIKVMHRHLARDPEARERFAREAKAVARLTHHNIPEIYDFSTRESESHYLVTELVEGASLAELLRTHEALPEIGALVVLGIVAALQHAHDHDIVHRDVKPENILVGANGVVKLTDFGIAQFIGLESMTITGTLVGSPAHMSPEQIDGSRDLDARADVWALGTVLFVVTTGELPFQAGTPHGVLKRIMEGKYADPRRLNPHIDSELRRIIRKCMTVERAGRYGSMNALFVELEAWLEERELTNVEAEISSWVNDPSAYKRDLSTRLVATLMARSQRDLSSKQRHRALEALNRVLTLDPDHDEALERVRKLNSRLKLRKIGGYLSLVALLTALGVAYFLTSGDASRTEQRALTARSAAELRPVRVQPALDRTTSGSFAGGELGRVSDLGAELVARGVADIADAGKHLGAALPEVMPRAYRLARRRPSRPKSGAATKSAALKRAAVKFRVTPRTATLTVDGRPVDTSAQLDLKVGSHRASLHLNKCPKGVTCKDKAKVFKVKPVPGVQIISLRYTFAMSVNVTCDGGMVYVTLKGRSRRRVGPCGRTHSLSVGLEPVIGVFSVVFPSGKVVKLGKRNVRPGARLIWSARE